MSLLKPMGTGQGYAKVGILGFQGSGKTFTAKEIAIGLRALFGLKGPIAMFDTESGSEYIAEAVLKATGQPLIGVRSQSFADLVTTMREAEEAGVAALIVDSLTHVYRDLTASYLAEVNSFRARKNLRPRTSLEFQDWGPIKERWAREWAVPYLNSKLNIIVCGRAGFEYGEEIDPETDKKQLTKLGVKMKAESEFGFEPSLLIEMEAIQTRPRGKGPQKRAIVNRATVLKDRFDLLNGRQADAPTFEFFKPHFDRLKPGAHAPVEAGTKTTFGIDHGGDGEFYQERRQRAILAEEIQGELVRIGLAGQSADEKAARFALFDAVFGTRSWTKISESTASEELRKGLAEIRRLHPREGEDAGAEAGSETGATESTEKAELAS